MVGAGPRLQGPTWESTRCPPEPCGQRVDRARYAQRMTEPLTFTLPNDRDALIEKFLSVSEGPQRMLLAVIQHGQPDPGQENHSAQFMEWLRTDERTRELVKRLESTPPPRLSKSKASRRAAPRKPLG